jgi:GT2 family glycosyltransferase
MKASVIVPSWNGVAYIGACLEALLAQDYPDFEPIVVDNGSTDGSAELVTRQYPAVRLIRGERNRGFSVAVNVGLDAATGDLLVLLNQDTVVQEGWLTALAATLTDPTIGIAGCKLCYPDGTVQHAGGYVYGNRGETDHLGRLECDEGQYDQLADRDFVTGAALALTRTSLARIGPLDEGFTPAYYEDVDWCYRARRAGLRVVYVPEARVVHHESASTGSASSERKSAWHRGRIRFLFKHQSIEWLRHQFAPAESEWIAVMPDRNKELMAVRSAYLSTILDLARIVSFRHGSVEEADGLVDLLTDLRVVSAAGLRVLQEESALAAVPYEPPPGATEPPQRAPQAGAATSEPDNLPVTEQGQDLSSVPVEKAQDFQTDPLWELAKRQQLHEHEFSSHVPLVGRLINGFRRLWGSISAQWYTRSIIQQQNAFNAAVVDYLSVVQGHVDPTSPSLRYQHELLTWLSRRADRLEATTTTQGHLLKGQLRDMAETVHEITALAEHLARVQKNDQGDDFGDQPVSWNGSQ